MRPTGAFVVALPDCRAVATEQHAAHDGIGQHRARAAISDFDGAGQRVEFRGGRARHVVPAFRACSTNRRWPSVEVSDLDGGV